MPWEDGVAKLVAILERRDIFQSQIQENSLETDHPSIAKVIKVHNKLEIAVEEKVSQNQGEQRPLDW